MDYTISEDGMRRRSFQFHVEICKDLLFYTRLSVNLPFEDLRIRYGFAFGSMLHQLQKFPTVTAVTIYPYAVAVSLSNGCKWDDNMLYLITPIILKAAQQAGDKKKLGAAKQKLMIEKGPARTVRAFHTDFEVSRSRYQSFHRPLRTDSRSYLTAVGFNGANAVEQILDIPGVILVDIYPYKIWVEIGPLFEHEQKWDDITARIIEVIEDKFGPVTIVKPNQPAN